MVGEASARGFLGDVRDRSPPSGVVPVANGATWARRRVGAICVWLPHQVRSFVSSLAAGPGTFVGATRSLRG